MESFAVLVVVAVVLAVAVTAARRASRPSLSTLPDAQGPQPSDEQSAPTSSVDVQRPPSRGMSRRPTAQLGRTPFAIVDVETTGFHPVPEGAHRIVEVAIVRMSPDGHIEDEYVTLVNPQGRMGATRVHGITQSDVQRAPSFADVAGDVARRLADAIVVAHNVPFDLKFLRGEYAHMGTAMPDVPRLCTLDLAYRLTNVSCRKLGFLCEEYGIPIDEHTALGDARAVSQLLMRFLAEGRSIAEQRLASSNALLARPEWCATPPSGLALCRAEARDTRTTLSLVSKRAVRQPVKLAEDRYFEMLELAIADGALSSEESAALSSLALELGVSASDLNRQFVESLATGAKVDGTVTSAEADEVYQTAYLLGISVADAVKMLEIDRIDAPKSRFLVSEGSPVCFLGQFDLAVMAQLMAVATERKLTIRKNITGTVEVVVVERSDSELKRQSRAKALGIPVVTAVDFMNLVERDLGLRKGTVLTARIT